VTGSVTAGRDVNFGLTSEQVKELTEAAARGATVPLTTVIVDLSKRLGVTEDAAKTLLRIVGEQDVPLERLTETLYRVANDYKRLQEQAAALHPNNPMARDLVTQARAVIDAGQFEQAHQLLREATQAQLAAAQAARKLREQAQAAEDAQMLGAASVTAVDAGVALTEGKYQQAAELFGQAAEYVPADHPDERSGYLSGQAGALYRLGEERGDNAALRQAIKMYGRVLEERTRERVPLQWAGSQNNLGIALRTLGERESGTARLDEAVAAYRAALEERTRELMPLDWATTQNNLGNALLTLGDRESGSARLEEAVAAYRAALEERTRERMPLQWATTQMNLGNALQTLGWRERGTARLEEAVAAYRAALEVQTRERVPFQWAETQYNLGRALWLLGKRESGTAYLEEAVAADRAALAETTRERMPQKWATTQVNLGCTLLELGKRERGTAHLEEAVAALNACLADCPQDLAQFVRTHYDEAQAEIARRSAK
jgi:tetratricopeptide (TPR) repeat protein